jgi:FAD/FMN-containing dehydrogenase
MIATSIAQSRAMWKLREGIAAAQTRHGESLKHDISVPVTALPALIERGTLLAQSLVPDGEVPAPPRAPPPPRPGPGTAPRRTAGRPVPHRAAPHRAAPLAARFPAVHIG